MPPPISGTLPGQTASDRLLLCPLVPLPPGSPRRREPRALPPGPFRPVPRPRGPPLSRAALSPSRNLPRSAPFRGSRGPAARGQVRAPEGRPTALFFLARSPPPGKAGALGSRHPDAGPGGRAGGGAIRRPRGITASVRAWEGPGSRSPLSRLCPHYTGRHPRFGGGVGIWPQAPGSGPERTHPASRSADPSRARREVPAPHRLPSGPGLPGRAPPSRRRALPAASPARTGAGGRTKHILCLQRPCASPALHVPLTPPAPDTPSQ